MAEYLLIESRDPFESRDTQFLADTSVQLKSRGNIVTVFLVQNAVLAARREARYSCVPQLGEAGVEVLADEFSLHERGIEPQELHAAIRPTSIETIVDLLVQRDTKAVWH